MVKQCSIIFLCLAAGELLSWLLKLPVPGSILGMLILTSLLQMKIVRVDSIKTISSFLISNMGFFFVPPGISLMLYFDIIAKEWFPITVATVASTVIVLIVTGWGHQLISKIRKNGVS